jgi:hypothetical protein
MRIVLPVEVVEEHLRYSLGHVLPVLPERISAWPGPADT